LAAINTLLLIHMQEPGVFGHIFFAFIRKTQDHAELWTYAAPPRRIIR